MAKTVWGASPLSTAANWLEKELFGTREAAKAALIPSPPPPPPPPPPPGSTTGQPIGLLLLLTRAQ